jgi:hypothetical protein
MNGGEMNVCPSFPFGESSETTRIFSRLEEDENWSLEGGGGEEIGWLLRMFCPCAVCGNFFGRRKLHQQKP